MALELFSGAFLGLQKPLVIAASVPEVVIHLVGLSPVSIPATGRVGPLTFCNTAAPPMMSSTSQKAGPGWLLPPLRGFMSFRSTPSVSSLPVSAGQSPDCHSVHQLRKLF